MVLWKNLSPWLLDMQQLLPAQALLLQVSQSVIKNRFEDWWQLFFLLQIWGWVRHNLKKKSINICRLPWNLLKVEFEDYDSQRPYITFIAIVVPRQYLWRHIYWNTNNIVMNQAFIQFLCLRNTKISNLIHPIMNQYIRRLQISMNNIKLPQISKTRTNLKEHINKPFYFFIHLLLIITIITILLFKHIPQIPTITVFSYYIKILISLHFIEQIIYLDCSLILHNIWVLQFLQDLYLFINLLFADHTVCQLQLFYCDWQLSLNICAYISDKRCTFIYTSKRALADTIFIGEGIWIWMKNYLFLLLIVWIHIAIIIIIISLIFYALILYLYRNNSTKKIYKPSMDKVSNFIGGLKGSVSVQVILDKKEAQTYFKIRQAKGQKIKLPIYSGNDDISGTIRVQLKDTKKFEHFGIKVALIGYLQIFSDKNLSTEFHSLSKQLEPAGFLTENKEFKFKFPSFEKEYETFNGIAGRVRYFIRATVNRSMKSTIAKQLDFAVMHYNSNVEETETVTQMKMQVGIQQCLHIQFQFDKHFYHLKDVILGRVFFHLVKIKIKYMEINLVRKQIFGTGTGAANKTQTENLVRYQVMDGCPEKGQVVPIRMYMNGVQLTPSYKNIHNRLQVKYSINLVLVDEEERRYFKQTEIIIYRKPA